MREPHQILGEKWTYDGFILHLLERLEVEVGLHELVLSYYRAWHMLPQTVDAFLTMLADWRRLVSTLLLDLTGCIERRMSQLDPNRPLAMSFRKASANPYCRCAK